MERRRLTMTEVVGGNVRRIRLIKNWSQEQLRIGLRDWGVKWSRPTVAQMELGNRPLSVDELLALALTLGVAPHLLLYPPSRSRVGLSDDVAVANGLIGSWLDDPDDHPLSTSREFERRFLYEALDMADQMPIEDIRRQAARMLRDRNRAAELASAQIEQERPKPTARQKTTTKKTSKRTRQRRKR
jgi:transcriptional regulator with XRE-family HTH domain